MLCFDGNKLINCVLPKFYFIAWIDAVECADLTADMADMEQEFLFCHPLTTRKRGEGSIFFYKYEGWNFNSGNYLFTTDTK